MAPPTGGAFSTRGRIPCQMVFIPRSPQVLEGPLGYRGRRRGTTFVVDRLDDRPAGPPALPTTRRRAPADLNHTQHSIRLVCPGSWQASGRISAMLTTFLSFDEPELRPVDRAIARSRSEDTGSKASKRPIQAIAPLGDANGQERSMARSRDARLFPSCQCSRLNITRRPTWRRGHLDGVNDLWYL